MSSMIQMPSCCGVRFFHNFGDLLAPTEIKDLDKWLYDQEKDAAEAVQSFVMALINNEQMDEFGWIFKKRGWKVVNKKEHVDHGSVIYLLVRNLSYGLGEKCISKIVAPGKIFEPKKKVKPKQSQVSSRAGQKTNGRKKAANKRSAVPGKSSRG